jgi:hypothetical protein
MDTGGNITVELLISGSQVRSLRGPLRNGTSVLREAFRVLKPAVGSPSPTSTTGASP